MVDSRFWRVNEDAESGLGITTQPKTACHDSIQSTIAAETASGRSIVLICPHSGTATNVLPAMQYDPAAATKHESAR